MPIVSPEPLRPQTERLWRRKCGHDTADTFVVRRPGSKGKFRAALPCKLPFEAEVVICEARDLLRVAKENPFGAESHGEL